MKVRYGGTNGRTQGERNDSSPAAAAAGKVTSAAIHRPRQSGFETCGTAKARGQLAFVILQGEQRNGASVPVPRRPMQASRRLRSPQ